LKLLVKHVLELAILIPLFVLVASVWITGEGLFLIFPVLLVSLLFISPLNRPPVLRFRSLGNLLGGALPLTSLFLPYSFLGGYPWYPLDPGPISWGVPELVLLGCLLSFLSRFGSIVTVAGILAWSGPFSCPANGCPPYVLGPGYWLAWAGAIASLFGRSWIFLPKSVEGRKLLGSLIFPTGLVLVIWGILLSYAWYETSVPVFVLTPVLVVTGLVLGGAGLSLYFKLESTTMGRIRRALQKPLL
jgi:hypothetical protein